MSAIQAFSFMFARHFDPLSILFPIPDFIVWLATNIHNNVF